MSVALISTRGELTTMDTTGMIWLAIGLAGNVIFGSRFLVQWIASERAGESTVPPCFWYLSIVGSSIFLLYAVHIGMTAGWSLGIPLVLSYGPNMLPYVRNIMLIRKKRRELIFSSTERPGPCPSPR
jgi:lipid-A-disaccharide synthase-like uncharacterized protein